MAFNQLDILEYFRLALIGIGFNENDIFLHEPYRAENLQRLPSAAIYFTSGKGIEDTTNDPYTNARGKIRRIWKRNINIKIDIYANLPENANGILNIYNLTSLLYREIRSTFDAGSDVGIDYTDWKHRVDIDNITESYPSFLKVDSNKIINQLQLTINCRFYEHAKN